jgi:hypothetical protein
MANCAEAHCFNVSVAALSRPWSVWRVSLRDSTAGIVVSTPPDDTVMP